MTLEILVWLCSVPLVTLAHEAGHALAARPAGYRVSSFGLGHGPPLARWRLDDGAVLYLGRWLLSGGACVAIPVDPVPQRRWLYQSGGLLAQLALALPLAHGLLVPGSPLRLAATFNLLALAFNLLPWRLGDHASDGWTLLAGWWSSGRRGQLTSRRRELERLLAHQRMVGAALGEAWCRLSLAWVDALVGRPPHLPHIDEVLLSFDPQVEALHALVAASVDRRAGRPLAALHRVRSLRDATLSERSESLIDLLTLLEARCYIDLREPRLTQRALARIAGVGGAVGLEAAAVRVELALVAFEQELCSLAELEAEAFRLARRIDGGFVDPAAAVCALWEASQRLAEEGRGEASVVLGRRARRAGERLLAEAPAADRAPLAERMGALGPVLAVAESER
ncbi:MAG: site-2 protease family protein [Alphaproteobacteria bacterium]|nr:site-2 protease family protein [Alphaproteobacteria bacterium]